MECLTLYQAPFLLYATPAHAVRDMHHVSNYPSTLEEPVRFGSFGRQPSGDVPPSISTKRILQHVTGNPVDAPFHRPPLFSHVISLKFKCVRGVCQHGVLCQCV